MGRADSVGPQVAAIASLISALGGAGAAVVAVLRSYRTEAAAAKAVNDAAMAKERAVDVDQFRAAADEWRQMRIEMRAEINALRREIEDCEKDKVTMQNRISKLERGQK